MDESDSTEGGSLSPRETVGVIVGIASIATILVLLVLIGLMFCKYYFFKRTHRHTHANIIHDRTNSGTFSREMSREHYYMSPRGGYSDKHNLGDSDHELSPAAETTAIAHYTEEDVRLQRRRTYIGSRQFPSGNLVLLNQLGEGEYGPVFRGEAYGLVPREKSRIVTVKMLKTDPAEEQRILFEQEIALFSSLNHLNVVGILAVCTDNSPECILLDAGTSHNDLLAYIRDKGKEMVGVVDGMKIVEEFRDLLRISDEVCLGMAYLSAQHIVHKDVALRNCILGPNRVVKIASFGLGQQFYPEAYHTLHGRNLPIRWMSPEAITHDIFSTQSDIWAFGVLMWELFTYGEFPFAETTNEEVLLQTEEGSTLSRPDKCPDDVFLVMSSCWEMEGLSRPSFLILHEHIFDLISPHLVEDHGD